MSVILLTAVILIICIASLSIRWLFSLRQENRQLSVQASGEQQTIENLRLQLQASITRQTRVEQSLQQLNDDMETRVQSLVQARTAVLERQANYDPLTGLANRQLLQDRLHHALAQAQRNSFELAVLFIDLDHFKSINDNFGHDVGDELLQIVAARLRDCVRRSDTVARLGGDEFVLILEKLGSREQITAVTSKILEAFDSPITLSQQPIMLGLSIGVGRYPSDANNARQLLKYADSALQQAKKQGRNQVCFYESELSVRAEQRVQMENDLRNALQEHMLALHYQPQIDLHNGAVIGVEALLRWRHPHYQQIPTRTLISLVESSGLITPVNVWILQNACAQLKQWQNQGLALPSVAVNLLTRQLLQADFIKQVDQVLAATGLSSNALKLEATEATLMHNRERTREILQELRSRGVQVAIDDFGSGYSSLSSLKRFPIDELKVDQAFVNHMVTDANDAAIVTAIVGLGRALGVRVIVEGIETAEQLNHVRNCGADAAQGYYISYPQPAEALQSWWYRRNSTAYDYRQPATNTTGVTGAGL